ncbi:MAG: 50S ribosomal protein L11 methyltransferase [Anaerolineales bacterium]
MSWIEVSLVVDGEMAEAVAEVLTRFVPNGGIVIESTAIADSLEGEGHPIGPFRVFGYLPADIKLEETRQRLEEALWYLGRIRPLPTPQFEVIEESGWTEAWKQHYKPVPIGRSLLILPAWLEAPDSNRIPVRIEPGMAFGTGTHPTTQLCLEMMEALLLGFDQPGQGNEYEPVDESDSSHRQTFSFKKESPGEWSIIDMGCGSAILSIAGLKLGASYALGVDIDAKAIDVAKENIILNGVQDGFEAGVGSIDDIQSGNFSLRRAPLVLANILAPVIIRMLDTGLRNLVSPGGVMILSGILVDQAKEVEEALAKHGCHIIIRRQMGDWIAYCCSFNDLSA